MAFSLGSELVSVGASSSIHLPAVAIDRVPRHLQICAWVAAYDPPGVVFNLTRPVVEQQHHVPILFMSDRQNLSDVAFTPGFYSSASTDGVALVMIWIDASSENAHIFAVREPPLYKLHHGMNWGADLFPSLRDRLSQSSIQIYAANPSTHFYCSTLATEQSPLFSVVGQQHPDLRHENPPFSFLDRLWALRFGQLASPASAPVLVNKPDIGIIDGPVQIIVEASGL
jgi:hypothetical protein